MYLSVCRKILHDNNSSETSLLMFNLYVLSGLGTPRSIRPLTQAFKDAQSDTKVGLTLWILFRLVLRALIFSVTPGILIDSAQVSEREC